MPECSGIIDAGFFTGLLHGFVAIWSLIVGIFWKVSVYQHCQWSWWYDFGFILGLVITIGLTIRLSLHVLIGTFLVWSVIQLFGVAYTYPAFVALGIALGVLGFFALTKIKEF